MNTKTTTKKFLLVCPELTEPMEINYPNDLSNMHHTIALAFAYAMDFEWRGVAEDAIAEFKQQDSFKQLSAFIDSGPNPGDVLRIKASSTPNNYVDENYCDDYIATLICVSEKSVSEQPTLSIADTLRQEVNSDFIHSIDYSYILQCIKDLSRIQSTVTLEKYKMLEVYTSAAIRWIESSLIKDGFTVRAENVTGREALGDDIYRLIVSGWIKP